MRGPPGMARPCQGPLVPTGYNAEPMRQEHSLRADPWMRPCYHPARQQLALLHTLLHMLLLVGYAKGSRNTIPVDGRLPWSRDDLQNKELHEHQRDPVGSRAPDRSTLGKRASCAGYCTGAVSTDCIGRKAKLYSPLPRGDSARVPCSPDGTGARYRDRPSGCSRYTDH